MEPLSETSPSTAITAAVDHQSPPPPRRLPKRFIKNQIPDSILNDPSLNAAISLLPPNYNFEIHKCIFRIKSSGAKRIALQFPEGLLMYSLIIADIISTFTAAEDVFVLGDVTYGACCVDDLSAAALAADLLIHYGHSCLVPIDATTIPCLYVFVEIAIDVSKLLNELRMNFAPDRYDSFVMAGTIQFASAIRVVKPELEKLGFRVLVPQARPLSAGEVLGCTAPSVRCSSDNSVLIFVADGRFHLEAFMIANPGVTTYRYDPYIGKLFLEEYDHVGMKEERRGAIERAKGARNWGIVLGTLGRQGNPRSLDRLEKKMEEKGMTWMVILMSEISPTRIALFEDSVDAWVQIACPRLSIDWGDAFGKPLLTTFEAEIALGDLPGWWERKSAVNSCVGSNNGAESSKNESCCSCSNAGLKVNEDACVSSKNESFCSSNVAGLKGTEEACASSNDGAKSSKNESCCSCNNASLKGKEEAVIDYPMDYYAQDGGEWNSCYPKKPARASQRPTQYSSLTGSS